MTDSSKASSVVFITGCSPGGIGFFLAEEFAKRGHIVYASARNPEKLKSLQATANIHPLVLDVGDEENIMHAVQAIVTEQGRIDIVINNAGISAPGAVIDVPLEQVRQTFDTNTFSILRIAKHVIPVMASRKSGVIVNMGSIVGNTSTAWHGIYAASKAAIHSLSEALYMECKPFNINVILIVPGAVKSRIAVNGSQVLNIPSQSLYQDYSTSISRRIEMSQGSDSMPTEEFARKVANHILNSPEKFYYSLGGKATLSWILLWLPRAFVLNYIWKILSRK